MMQKEEKINCASKTHFLKCEEAPIFLQFL